MNTIILRGRKSCFNNLLLSVLSLLINCSKIENRDTDVDVRRHDCIEFIRIQFALSKVLLAV